MGQTFFIPMSISLSGVCTYLNAVITEYICGIRSREEAATTITLCLNGITDEQAFTLVDTNGSFIIDELTGRIKGIPGVAEPDGKEKADFTKPCPFCKSEKALVIPDEGWPYCPDCKGV